VRPGATARFYYEKDNANEQLGAVHFLGWVVYRLP